MHETSAETCKKNKKEAKRKCGRNRYKNITKQKKDKGELKK